jgi:Ran GTPase-activating protein (RanGAP) involved in mRNA processing and transport
MLDISNVQSHLEGVLEALMRSNLKLSILKVSKVELQPNWHLILALVRDTTTLTTLNISQTKISPGDVGMLITTVNANKNIPDFHLRLNHIDLKNEGLLPIFRTFLEVRDLSKWRSISLNNDNLAYEDLRNLIPLLQLCPDLHALSLSGNFDDSMTHIDSVLVDLLQFANLQELTLRGTPDHKLRRELIPLIKALGSAKPGPVIALDISDNEIGVDGIGRLVDSVQTRHQLAHCAKLNIDGNATAGGGHQMIETIERFRAIVGQGNLIEFDFPRRDVAMLLEQVEPDDRASVVRRMADLQVFIVATIADGQPEG